MDTRRLQKLCELQEIRYHAASRDLAECVRSIAQIRVEIERLRGADTGHTQTILDSAAFAKHLAWRDSQLQKKNMELANKLAEQENAKQSVRREFGRRQALNRLKQAES